MANSINDLIDQKLREAAKKKAMDEMRQLRDLVGSVPISKCLVWDEHSLRIELNQFCNRPTLDADRYEPYRAAIDIRANQIYEEAVKKYKNKVDAVVAEVFKDDPFLVEEVDMEEAKEIQKASTNV